ncbi:MAG: Rieske 2Fe-2S domain-containing protein [Streptosporangiaceae bacterium]|nr:Rieske 2Fe-2S domain-containing protein [Streptosporangiaceae bacterium]
MSELCMPDVTLPPVHSGWYLLGFDSEIGRGVTPLDIGRRLIAVRGRDRIRVFDATCPHRGAHLGYGGRLVESAGGPGQSSAAAGGPGQSSAVICPFHGKRIGLGGPGRLSVAEHHVVRVGDAVFVRLSGDPAQDRGFGQVLADLAEQRIVIGALSEHVPVPPELIVENAFDAEHFSAVHLVPRVTGMEIKPGETGELVIEGEFATAPPFWEKGQAKVVHSRFVARAYSPGIVVTEVGPPDRAHVVITAASPAPGGCLARFALAIRPGQIDEFGALAAGARHAFKQDFEVWSHLDPAVVPRLDSRDATVVAFREFCAGFPAA